MTRRDTQPDDLVHDPYQPQPVQVPEARKQLPRLALAAVLGLLIGQAGVISTDVGHLGAAARAERVYLDMQTIAAGLRQFSEDGRFQEQGLQRVSWMYGPGELPRSMPFADGDDASPMSRLQENEEQRYIQILMPDPWGNAYLANVDGLQAGTQRIKVLSAGPDGVIETAPADTEAQGDDILIHLF